MNLLRIIAAHLAHTLRRIARRLDGSREPAPLSPQARQRGLKYLDQKIADLNAARQMDWVHNAPERMPLVALNLSIVTNLRDNGLTLQEFCARHKISRTLLNEALQHEHGAIWEARRRAAEILGFVDLYAAAFKADQESRRTA